MHVLLCSLFGAAVFPFVTKSYENVALKKTTWQQYPFPNINYSAYRAVDGQKSNLATFGGECAVSLNGYKTTEWRVDLGDVLYIHHIIIQFATNNHVWGENNTFAQFFLGFSVYISNTTNKDNGVLCLRDTDYTRATIPNPVNITCPSYGRYVIYYNNRTHKPYPDGYSVNAFFALCEVEVFGCPTQRFYGEDFCLPCPANCQGGLCDKMEGTCQSCVAGYTGRRCYEECPFGLFGQNCQRNCSINCEDTAKCDKVSGTCEGGCKSGWKGFKCDEKCQIGLLGQNCQKICNVNCKVQTKCDKVTGTCEGGCKSGWKGSKCDEKLPEVQGNNPIIRIGVYLTGGVLVTTTIVFILTSKRIKVKTEVELSE